MEIGKVESGKAQKQHSRKTGNRTCTESGRTGKRESGKAGMCYGIMWESGTVRGGESRKVGLREIRKGGGEWGSE